MSSLTIPPRTSDYTGDPLPTSKVDAADLDGDITTIRQTLTDVKAVLDGLLRGDDTILDGYLRTRMMHPEVLDYIQANGGGGQISGGSPGTSVKAAPFNATGDGVTDDTDAIQACIDAVNAAGGGVVYFPAGTYLLRIAITTDPTWKHALRIYPNIQFRGESRESSVLKLKDNAGNYRAFLAAAEDVFDDISNFGMYDLTFDQNNDGNVPPASSALTTNGGGRHILVCFGGHHVRVVNITVKRMKNVNTLTFNAPVGNCSDVLVMGCRFEYADSTSVDQDHSTIYTSATDVTIIGNTFYAFRQNIHGCGSAVEVHGSRHVVAYNIMQNIYGMANLTGVAFESKNNIVSHNVGTGLKRGFHLWSWFHAGNTTEPGLEDLLISNNVVELDRDPWTLYANLTSGVTWDQSASGAPCRGVRIIDNVFRWLPSTLNNASDSYSCGIDWSRPTIGGQGFDEEIEIRGNQFIGCMSNGIAVRNGAIKNLLILDNVIRNCGRSTYGGLALSQRAAILAYPASHLVGWLVSRNQFIDDQVTPTMTYGMSCANTAATDCRFEDNHWRVGPAHAYAVYAGSFQTAAAWYVRQTVNTIGQGLSGFARMGSTLLAHDTGRTEYQVASPSGNTYVSVPVPFGYSVDQIPRADATGGLFGSANFRYVEGADGKLVVGGTIGGNHILNGPSGSYRSTYWQTANVSRVEIGVAGAESGSDAGANLGVYAYTDAGSYIDLMFQFERKAGRPVYSYRPFAPIGGFSPKQVVLNVDSTLTVDQAWVFYQGAGGHVYTAPAAGVLGSGRPWFQWVRNYGTGTLTYRRAGSDTINGATLDILLEPGDSAMFIGNGATDIQMFSKSGADSTRIGTKTLRGVNLNSAATDVVTIARWPARYRIRRVTVTNASISLTTATFSLRNASGGGGTALVSAAGLSALTTSFKVVEPALAVLDAQTSTLLYLRNDTAQGAAATADFIIEYEDLR